MKLSAGTMQSGMRIGQVIGRIGIALKRGCGENAKGKDSRRAHETHPRLRPFETFALSKVELCLSGKYLYFPNFLHEFSVLGFVGDCDVPHCLSV
jgi:hypothetical protein